MQWIQHNEITVGKEASLERSKKTIRRLQNHIPVSRRVLEANLGADAVPRVSRDKDPVTQYSKAWYKGHPVLVMRVFGLNLCEEQIVLWFSREAHATWRIDVLGDRSVVAPRGMAKVHATGDESSPYVIQGHRIGRWNASQDLPKNLVGATRDDPDGNVFLSRLGGRRWKPMAHALVVETVKDAMRPVPDPTGTRRYQSVPLGDGLMIRYGVGGPTWIDADGVVHLAGLAGYPLGDPNDISPSVGGEGWSRLWDMTSLGADRLDDVAARLVHAEDIAYEAFAGEIGTDDMKRVFPEFRWGRGGRQGERLRDMQEARYSRALYGGHPVIRAAVRNRVEIWLSSSAAAHLIKTLSTPTATVHPDEPRLRKRQRKAVARLARAIERLQEEGLSLVVHDGTLKTKVNDEQSENKGLVTILPGCIITPIDS